MGNGATRSREQFSSKRVQRAEDDSGPWLGWVGVFPGGGWGGVIKFRGGGEGGIKHTPQPGYKSGARLPIVLKLSAARMFALGSVVGSKVDE